MRSRLLHLRLWLENNGLFPRGKLAFVTLYLLALDVLIFVIEKLATVFRESFANYLGSWVVFLTFVVVILGGWLAMRWASSRMLWRLRNRLIVTYIFIGVIPLVLLVGLAIGAFYLFAGQFATFIVTSRLEAELKSLEASNTAAAREIRTQFDSSGNIEKALQATSDRQLWVFLDGRAVSQNPELAHRALPHSLPAQFTGVVREDGKLSLRSATSLQARNARITVVSTRPFDQSVLRSLATNLGELTLFPEIETSNGFPTPTFTVGTVPEPTRALDRQVSFAAAISVADWRTETPAEPAAIRVQTRLSKVYDHLSLASAFFAPAIQLRLIALVISFAIIEIIALLIGSRLTRSITGAVGQLYEATVHVNRGDFSHRVPTRSNDQIAALAGSFNLMTASIEKLILEQKEKQRLQNEISIAQEVQAQLFPRHIKQLPSLEVYGFCRPARSVSGDYYDFLPLGSERLVLAVGDVSGKGISAALLMATIHSAVRAYSMEGIPALRQMQAVGAGPALVTYDPVVPGAEVSPGILLGLMNHQLYHSTPAEKYATLFLALYDGNENRLTFSNAGHLPPLLISESGTVRKLEDGGTVVGLFDDMRYDEASVQLKPGEIFLAYSDGVTEPENDFGEFGEQRLIELVQENRDLPLGRIADIVTAAVDDWIGGAEQPDDVTLVLARAR
jgi:sigma-B regulation protein RsbU (phosphoserine phosphatase)